MISYYKFTYGDSFSLNDSSYSGLVHIVNGKPFTGAYSTVNSKPLSSSFSYNSEILINNINYTLPTSFNTGSLLSQLKLPVIFPRDILNINLLTENLNILKRNNLLLFSTCVKFNKNYFNLQYRDIANMPYVYALSSLDSTLQNQKLPLFTIPFSKVNESVSSLVEPKNISGSLFLTGDDSKLYYYNNNKVFSGMINSVSGISVSDGIGETVDFTHDHLHFNPYQDRIYQTNSSDISIFSFDYELNSISLIDKVLLSNINKPISREAVGYGRNYRSVLVSDAFSINVIEIYELTSSSLVETIQPEELKVDVLLNVCQRFEDDILVVLATKEDQPILMYIDIAQFLVDRTIAGEPKIVSDLSTLPTQLELSNFDSDLIYFKYYENNYLTLFQVRSLGNPLIPFANINKRNCLNIRLLRTIDEITSNCEDTTEVCLDDLRDSNLNLLDIKFFPKGNKLFTIVVSDSYIITDDSSVYTNLIPLDTQVNFYNLPITDSSIGLILNNSFELISKDTMTLYFNFSQYYTSSLNLPTFISNVDIKELQMYSNESVNISTLNRAMKKLYAMQTSIANSITI